MQGKLINKDNNLWIEFDNDTLRKYYKESFLGDYGYVLINGEKVKVVIDIFKKTAKTY